MLKYMCDLITIVVPIYNVEKILSECINSIINQTYKELEIILVDDGSTDSSGSICDEFAKKDKRIVVYHKINEGVGSARNLGINNSNGKYIQFVDSDDFLDGQMTEKLYNAIQKSKADMSVCGISIYDNSRIFKKNYVKKIHYLMDYNDEIFISEYLKELAIYKTDVFFGAPYNKLYKLEIIKNNNINFEIDTNLGEDFIFNIKILENIKKIAIVKECLYYYRRNVKNSLSKTKRESLYILCRYDEMYECYKKLYIKNNAYNINCDKVDGFYKLGLLRALKNCIREEDNKSKRIDKIKNICEGARKRKLILSDAEDKVINNITICINENKIKKLYGILIRDYIGRYVIRIPYYKLQSLKRVLYDK